MNHRCTFCIEDKKIGNTDVLPERILHEYKYWWLVLQLESKRLDTKQAAGLLIIKRHTPVVSKTEPLEAQELLSIYKDAGRRLCEAVHVSYTNQETVAFNEGAEAGQTIMHAHVHILPVAFEDPEELKIRGGVGGAFEALRRERLTKRV